MRRLCNLALVISFFLMPNVSLEAHPSIDKPYLTLLEDVFYEAKHFAGESNVDDATLERFNLQWRELILGQRQRIDAGPIEWQRLWPPESPQERTHSSDVKSIAEPATTREGHSIDQVDKYLSDRLGKHVYELSQRGDIELHAFAGKTSSFLAKSDELYPMAEVSRIPSLFEHWGIEKFYVRPQRGGRPKLYFVIPPIKEYAIHYANMIKLAGQAGTRVEISQNDRESFRFGLHQKIAELWSKLESHPQHVILGYSQHWKELFDSKLSNDWQLVAPPNRVATSDGQLGATSFTIQSRFDPGKVLSLTAIDASITIWGEASAFIVHALGQQSTTKSIYFLGSAGAPSELGKIYDVSVPRAFVFQNQILPVENALLSATSRIVWPADMSVLNQAIHTHTNTPAEQTLEFTTGLTRKNASTIDVEQTLIASTIADLQSRGKHIRFGAANIITDKPRTRDTDWRTSHDLSHVDANRKQAARLVALHLVFEDLTSWQLNMRSIGACENLRFASGF